MNKCILVDQEQYSKVLDLVNKLADKCEVQSKELDDLRTFKKLIDVNKVDINSTIARVEKALK